MEDFVRSGLKFIFDLATGMLFIQAIAFVRGFEIFNLPRPNWWQTYGIVLIILTVSPR